MMKWDYTILNVGEKDDWIKIQDALEGLGKKGWELVTITEDIHPEDLNRRLYIFKKPIE